MVDIRLPPTHTDEGLRAADRIRSQFPATAVMILSQYVEAEYVAPLITSGAVRIGYLLKDRVLEPATLVDGLRRVVAGECVIDPALVAEASPRERLRRAVGSVGARDRGPLADRRRADQRRNRSPVGLVRTHDRGARSTHLHQLGLSHGEHVNRRVVSALVFLGLRATPPC